MLIITIRPGAKWVLNNADFPNQMGHVKVGPLAQLVLS